MIGASPPLVVTGCVVVMAVFTLTVTAGTAWTASSVATAVKLLGAEAGDVFPAASLVRALTMCVPGASEDNV